MRDSVMALRSASFAELERRVLRYRSGLPALDVSGRTVILVDDGIATGATARAAILWLRARRPRRLILAVPVVSAATARELAGEVDDVVAVAAPEDLDAIGACYARFEQVSDAEVVSILERRRDPCATARRRLNPCGGGASTPRAGSSPARPPRPLPP